MGLKKTRFFSAPLWVNQGDLKLRLSNGKLIKNTLLKGEAK